MPVPMHPVTSSNLSYIGWQDNVLYITFHNGGRYKYDDVPEDVFNEFKNSSSVGSYYHRNIKGNYTSEKL